MPIMAVADQNDARGTAQYLARTARKCLEGILEPSTHQITLNKIFRLLNSYRSHEFAGYRYQPRSLRGPEALTLMPAGDRRMNIVGQALEDAMRETYVGVERDSVFDKLDIVITTVANKGVQAVDIGDRDDASRFLESFVEHLQPRM